MNVIGTKEIVDAVNFVKNAVNQVVARVPVNTGYPYPPPPYAYPGRYTYQNQPPPRQSSDHGRSPKKRKNRRWYRGGRNNPRPVKGSAKTKKNDPPKKIQETQKNGTQPGTPDESLSHQEMVAKLFNQNQQQEKEITALKIQIEVNDKEFAAKMKEKDEELRRKEQNIELLTNILIQSGKQFPNNIKKEVSL